MSDSFRAFRLPRGVEPGALSSLEVGTLECAYPDPTPDLLEATVRAARQAGRDLVHRPVLSIVKAIDAAAARLTDRGDALREEAVRLIPRATGYSPRMAVLVLERMAAGWRSAPLRRLLETELGDPTVLDAFTPAGPGRNTRAYGPGLGFHVFAGNVPGVAVTSMVRSLLVKSPVVGKLASGEPVLPVLFARALASVDPDLADALAVTYWPGGAEDAEWRMLQAADVVVVYGGDEVVSSFRARAPAHDRLVVHGPRLSVGLIGNAALGKNSAALARAVARAVATFDQHGCVSPHALWVEDARGEEARAFAEELGAALESIEQELPRGTVSAGEASAIHQARGAAEMRGHAGESVRVFAGGGTSWTVVYDPEPVFRTSCLNRFVYVHPIEHLQDAVDLLAPVGNRLQSVAIAGTDARHPDIAHALARAGATRITTFERLPWPPPEWHHDGRGALRELLHWVDLEY